MEESTNGLLDYYMLRDATSDTMPSTTLSDFAHAIHSPAMTVTPEQAVMTHSTHQSARLLPVHFGELATNPLGNLHSGRLVDNRFLTWPTHSTGLGHTQACGAAPREKGMDTRMSNNSALSFSSMEFDVNTEPECLTRGERLVEELRMRAIEIAIESCEHENHLGRPRKSPAVQTLTQQKRRLSKRRSAHKSRTMSRVYEAILEKYVESEEKKLAELRKSNEEQRLRNKLMQNIITRLEGLPEGTDCLQLDAEHLEATLQRTECNQNSLAIPEEELFQLPIDT